MYYQYAQERRTCLFSICIFSVKPSETRLLNFNMAVCAFSQHDQAGQACAYFEHGLVTCRRASHAYFYIAYLYARRRLLNMTMQDALASLFRRARRILSMTKRDAHIRTCNMAYLHVCVTVFHFIYIYTCHKFT